jgi:hypothetical protein
MEIHEELSNPEIVTIAVNNLGGAVNPIELEDVAIEAFDLAPRRFSWKKYQDRIDLRIVLYSVNDAIKPDVGYLKGNSKHGYMLTEAGLEWIAKIEDSKVFTKSARKFSASDLMEKEKLRLQRTSAFHKYLQGDFDRISVIDFREFTRVNDYFPKHMREQRFAKIQNVADNDQDLAQVWEFLKKKFLAKE